MGIADIVSLPRDWLVAVIKFFEEQFLIWLEAIKSPIAVISRYDFNALNWRLPILRFVLFVYSFSFVLSVPRLALYYGIDIKNPLIILVDFIITMLVFAIIGFCLYIAGKAIGGRGTLSQNMVGAVYIIALWPILDISAYFILASPQRLEFVKTGKWPLDSSPAIFDLLILAIPLAIAIYVLVKAIPVIRYIHSIGRIRAIFSCFLWFLFSFCTIMYPFAPLTQKWIN
jgi:hypothetical protein